MSKELWRLLLNPDYTGGSHAAWQVAKTCSTLAAASPDVIEVLNELVTLRAENAALKTRLEALEAQAATRPDVHTFMFGSDSWHLLHPMDCDVRSCEIVDDENLVEDLVETFGVGAIVELDRTAGWRKVKRS
jgi:hypothetical protein